MVLEPDQVALLGAYVLIGLVVAHWLSGGWPSIRAQPGAGWRRRPRRDRDHRAAAALDLALRRGDDAAGGRSHRGRPRLAASGLAADRLRRRSVWRARSVGRVLGALQHLLERQRAVPVAEYGAGLYRRAAAAAADRAGADARLALRPGDPPLSLLFVFMVLFALGRYTPFFHVVYDYLPGVKAFRRPADATFLIGGLGAVLSGYVLHRVLTTPELGSLRREADRSGGRARPGRR